MQIAICEDQPADMEVIKNILQNWLEKHEYSFDIRCFASGESMLESDAPFDIILMDNYLPGLTGVETLKRYLASRKSNPKIVFITTSKEFAVDAFSLHAAHYLMKPLTPEKIDEAMRRCLPAADDSILELPARDSRVFIRTDQILYVEVFDKVCHIHTTQDVVEVKIPLWELAERLNQNEFLRVQRSYLIAMKHVQSFHTDRVVMSDGRVIPLSRKNRKALKETYEQYMFQKVREDFS